MKKFVILATMLFCNVAYSAENHDIDSACNYDAVCVVIGNRSRAANYGSRV